MCRGTRTGKGNWGNVLCPFPPAKRRSTYKYSKLVYILLIYQCRQCRIFLFVGPQIPTFSWGRMYLRPVYTPRRWEPKVKFCHRPPNVSGQPVQIYQNMGQCTSPMSYTFGCVLGAAISREEGFWISNNRNIYFPVLIRGTSWGIFVRSYCLNPTQWGIYGGRCIGIHTLLAYIIDLLQPGYNWGGCNLYIL